VAGETETHVELSALEQVIQGVSISDLLEHVAIALEEAASV
jgi:hypothetical protein